MSLPQLSSPVGAQAPRARRRSRRNVAVLCHTEYVPTLTAAAALLVKDAVVKLRGLGGGAAQPPAPI